MHILSGRLGKWAYGLVEYDLVYESLKSIKGQIVADFIIEHRVNIEYDLDIGLILLTSWKVHFDGSVCSDVIPNFYAKTKYLSYA
jgi:hypothetical protein